MIKHLRILGLFWSTSLAAEMEYRTNLALAIITALGNLVGAVFAMKLFFIHQKTLGGYSEPEAMVVLGYFVLLSGFANTVMVQNLSRIVTHVREGTLDFVLLKPIDSQFWLSTRNCSPWGIPNIVLGLGLIAYAGWQLKFDAIAYLTGVIALAAGLLMLYSLWFSLGALSIWFVKVQNITHVLYQLLEGGRFPFTAHPTFNRFFFTFVIPAAFLTTFPAQVMIGRNDFQQYLGASNIGLYLIVVAMAVAMFIFARYFWRFTLRHYTSASS
ncbi:MAG: ABC transporter permease [Planctomycetaceae bacterium]|nr:ABC transporter permease [Planctomycetaceae bacterium]